MSTKTYTETPNKLIERTKRERKIKKNQSDQQA
jgi:hypothetical protein